MQHEYTQRWKNKNHLDTEVQQLDNMCTRLQQRIRLVIPVSPVDDPTNLCSVDRQGRLRSFLALTWSYPLRDVTFHNTHSRTVFSCHVGLALLKFSTCSTRNSAVLSPSAAAFLIFVIDCTARSSSYWFNFSCTPSHFFCSCCSRSLSLLACICRRCAFLLVSAIKLVKLNVVWHSCAFTPPCKLHATAKQFSGPATSSACGGVAWSSMSSSFLAKLTSNRCNDSFSDPAHISCNESTTLVLAVAGATRTTGQNFFKTAGSIYAGYDGNWVGTAVGRSTLRFNPTL